MVGCEGKHTHVIIRALSRILTKQWYPVVELRGPQRNTEHEKVYWPEVKASGILSTITSGVIIHSSIADDPRQLKTVIAY